MDKDDICALDRIVSATDDEIYAALLAEIERDAVENDARETGV